MNGSHAHDPDLPAHRVVNRSGLLSGKHHFTGVPMQDLLENEGIRVTDNRIENFDSVFWDPSEELEYD